MGSSILKHFLLLLLLLSVAAFSYKQVRLESIEAKNTSSVDEALYLPRGEGLKFMSFGYETVLAQALWFSTINYFGKHYHGNRNYRWLDHMCTLVTDLNHDMDHVYEFCGLMLAWEANLPQESLALLDDGIARNPDKWKFHYLRGMTHLIFMKDEAKATIDFVNAAKLPGAHSRVITLAAKKLSVTENSDTAIEFLKESIANTKDDWERKVFSDRLKELYLEKDLGTLQQALDIYREKTSSSASSLEQLVEQGIIKSLPSDPYGGSYVLNPSTGKPESTSQTK